MSWSYSYLLRLPLGISTRQISVSSAMTRHYRLPPAFAPRRAVISAQMRLRTPITIAATLALLLATAAPAMAHAGEGWAGELNDKVITFFSLGVMLFFVLVIIVGSTIQGRLEKKKEQKKAAQALARTGWERPLYTRLTCMTDAARDEEVPPSRLRGPGPPPGVALFPGMG